MPDRVGDVLERPQAAQGVLADIVLGQAVEVQQPHHAGNRPFLCQFSPREVRLHPLAFGDIDRARLMPDV